MDAVRWISSSPTGLPGKLRLLDQTLLPLEKKYVELDDRFAIYDAIKRLVVRGAPAIGCAGAFGLVAIAQYYQGDFEAQLEKDAQFLRESRPTAVNLAWAINRCLLRVSKLTHASLLDKKVALLQEAMAIFEEDLQMCRKIGEFGLSLFKKSQTQVLTHCNAGALATSDYGTALAPIYAAHQAGLHPEVFADETRPLLQGARLTAWELKQAKIPVTVICDNMAGYLMQQNKIDFIIVGADRITANGDVANKIGTYSLAILAQYHQVPFYVAAPSSTFDLSMNSGAQIPIELRTSSEISHGFGRQTTPDGIKFYNPAFDVTPAHLITGFITEKGIILKNNFSQIPQFLESGLAVV